MTSKTSITYGGALYDLAKDEDLSAQILADLGAFAAVFRENPDYRRLLTEPSIPKAEREALLDAELLLEVHDHLNGVERVDAEALERGVAGDLILRNIQL